MLGFESERRLKNLVLGISEGEQQIERLRQRLCEIKDMSPNSLFQRLDRDCNNYISSYEVLQFLRECGIYDQTESECYALVKFFDSDDDFRLSVYEYISLPSQI